MNGHSIVNDFIFKNLNKNEDIKLPIQSYLSGIDCAN